MAYISLYSYFSSRGRFGVVANNSRHVKDLYLIPLSAEDPIPPKLLPFEGPGKPQLFGWQVGASDPAHPLPTRVLLSWWWPGAHAASAHLTGGPGVGATQSSI